MKHLLINNLFENSFYVKDLLKKVLFLLIDGLLEGF